MNQFVKAIKSYLFILIEFRRIRPTPLKNAFKRNKFISNQQILIQTPFRAFVESFLFLLINFHQLIKNKKEVS